MLVDYVSWLGMTCYKIISLTPMSNALLTFLWQFNSPRKPFVIDYLHSIYNSSQLQKMKLIHIENKSFTLLPLGNENSWEKLYAIALCELGGNMENLKHVFNDVPQIFPSLPTLCLPPICCHILSIIYVLQNDYTFCSAHLHWPKPTLRTNWCFFYFVFKKRRGLWFSRCDTWRNWP